MTMMKRHIMQTSCRRFFMNLHLLKEEVQCIDYDYDKTTPAPSTGVGQSDQQSSQELNPKDSEEHLKETSTQPSRKQRMQPYIDYSVSLLLTDNNHIEMVKDLQQKREDVAREMEVKQIEDQTKKKDNEKQRNGRQLSRHRELRNKQTRRG